MFIRTAGERDLEAIKALLAETWHAIYGQKRVNEITAEWHSMAALRARLTHPHSEFLVADDGKAIAGMAFAASVDEGRVVWLRQLYVLPAQQRRGIGAMLLDEVSESFPEASLIRLEVEAENLNAIGFYRAQGFIVSDAAETTQDEVSVVVMEKALA